jgi:hypothetical protein
VSRLAVLLLAVCGGAACVYYNAMWSAERFAKEARKAEARGSTVDARSWWARAADKAESVVVQHPASRWAQPALVLQGEGLARSGACDRAAAPLARALRSAADEALRERAALAAAECALDANDPGAAGRQLADVTASRDGGRRSRAAFLSGRVAQLERDYASAAEWYQRSADPAAGPARARVLLAANRTEEAIALVDTLARARFREGDWAALFDDVASEAGPAAASRALDRLLARRRVPAGVRARLLLADGDRLLAAGWSDSAGPRYAEVTALVPDSIEGQRARVRQIRVLAAHADSVPDLVAVSAQLARVTRVGTAGLATGDTRALETLLRRVLDPEEAQEGSEFQTAELVRDSLGAPRLAARLFLAFAQRRPASLFAPKALLAAGALLPDARDSVNGVLDARYAASPYTLALRGDLSPAFAAAEDSLARALGLDIGAPMEVPFGSQIALPVPGPRGPPLDPPSPAAPAAAPRPGRPRAPRAEPRRPGVEPRDAGARTPPSSVQPRDTL